MSLEGVPPICASEHCVHRTRPFKNDATRFTKHCDTCSGAKTMDVMLMKSAAEARLGQPICQHASCLKPARLWKGQTDKYTKFCDTCSDARKQHWTVYKQYLEGRLTKPSA